MPDVVEAAKEADILVFVVPHQFIPKLCSNLEGFIKPTAVGLSLIKVFLNKMFYLKSHYVICTRMHFKGI